VLQAAFENRTDNEQKNESDNFHYSYLLDQTIEKAALPRPKEIALILSQEV